MQGWVCIRISCINTAITAKKCRSEVNYSMKKFLRTLLSMLLVMAMLLGGGAMGESTTDDLWDMAAPDDTANPDA